MTKEQHSWNRQELLIYGVLWIMVFTAPVLSLSINATQEGDAANFLWADVFHAWKQCAVFFAVFLVHNFLLAPLLVERQRKLLYFSTVTVLLALFITVQCTSRPDMQKPSFDKEIVEPRPPHHDAFDENGDRPHDGVPRFEDTDGHMPPLLAPEKGPRHAHRPPFIFGLPDFIATIILVLMLGMNLGVKLYFRQRRDEQRLSEMEHQNLEQQLEFLKYQINPHFLMNTLNNIHALVDIEPEQAKETIVELSKIMRFVLYEGSKQKVPLSRELQFLENYIELMRMRLTDQVKLNVELPDPVPDSEVPPLLFITFVENAFKHGVSYRQPSFISVSLSASDQRLNFTCSNSKLPQAEEHHGGVGLQNARRRLQLIYGNRYDLRIDNATDTYTVNLSIDL